MQPELVSKRCGKTAMAIAAHPDDIEFMMSGTLMRLGQLGWQLHYMSVANGSCGSMEHDSVTTASIRAEEAQRACQIIGAQWHRPLVNDLEVFYEESLLRKIAAIIREVEPDILLIHSPVDYMEDHTNACRLAVSAAFTRGMPNFQTEPVRNPVGGSMTLYHAMPHELCDPFGVEVKADYYVDVTDMMDRKHSALAAHTSQKQWLDQTQGMGSYLKHMESMMKRVGEQSGKFTYAEGWRPHSHMGFCAREDNPLKDALGGAYFHEPALD